MESSSFCGASHHRYSSSSSSPSSPSLFSLDSSFAARAAFSAAAALVFFAAVAAVFAFLAIGASESDSGSFLTPFVFLAEDVPFDVRFLGFARGSSSDSSLISFFVAFFALASARMALASFAAAFSIFAFFWAILVPSGWSSSSDESPAPVSLMEGGSFAPFFLAIGSSSLSDSVFMRFGFWRLAYNGQPRSVSVAKLRWSMRPSYQRRTVVAVGFSLVLARLPGRTARLAFGSAVRRGIDVHAIVLDSPVANRDARGRRAGLGIRLVHLAVGRG